MDFEFDLAMCSSQEVQVFIQLPVNISCYPIWYLNFITSSSRRCRVSTTTCTYLGVECNYNFFKGIERVVSWEVVHLVVGTI